MSASTPSILERIVAVKRKEVALGRASVSDEEQFKRARHAVQGDPRRGFAEAILGCIRKARTEPGSSPALIAEIKRASPSKGIIRDPFDPVDIAGSYERAGASCLSILTDREFFQGGNDILGAVRKACGLPLLRKDFVIDDWQVAESAVIGADAILLIVACLDQQTLESLFQQARELGLDVLVEVHDADELERALRLDDALIGINNRNLHDFRVSLDTTIGLLRHIPPERPVVTESGIMSAADVARMRQADVHAFLIGESVLRAPDPGTALRALIA